MSIWKSSCYANVFACARADANDKKNHSHINLYIHTHFGCWANIKTSIHLISWLPNTTTAIDTMCRKYPSNKSDWSAIEIKIKFKFMIFNVCNGDIIHEDVEVLLLVYCCPLHKL